MAFMCSFLLLPIYRCLTNPRIRIFYEKLRKRENKCLVFFQYEKKIILTLSHYEQVIVTCSVAVMLIPYVSLTRAL